MGSAYGGLVALSPAVVAQLFGVEGLGGMLGALFTSSSLSSLAGPPIVGLLIDYTGSYLWPAIFAGASGLAAFLVLIPLGRTAAAIDTDSAPAGAAQITEPAGRSAPQRNRLRIG